MKEPEANATYYVKEVDKKLNHLRCIYRYTYKLDGTDRVTWFCAISSIDDLNYKESGFIVNELDGDCSGIDQTITVTSGNKQQTVTRANLGGSASGSSPR